MIKKVIQYALVVSLIGVLSVRANDAELGKLFDDAKSDGTLVIASLAGDTRHVWNEERAQTRYTPASTFKIPNTLIALEEGIDKDRVFKWDGEKRFVEDWNQDQTLASAFRVSCVWTYQAIAKTVGKQSYLAHLAKLNYGNAKTGDEVTTFWLNGDLQISVEEQIEFLKGIYRQDYPYSAESYRILKNIMIVEQTDDYTIRAKTGWTFRKDEKIRWYVGYVVSQDKVWFFAANIDMAEWRKGLIEDEIVMKALRLKGIINN